MGTVATPPTKGRFGTFTGVFTPNFLTILGIILFLRSGWVVGQAGLRDALLIIGLANLISLLTGLSLSAVATSMNVRAGGAYYLISRSLGLEIGGAIGIPLFLSQAISVAFYTIGFSEALTSVHPSLDPQVLSTVVVLAFGTLAYVGADLALRMQFVVFGMLLLALVSFFGGSWGAAHAPTMASGYTAGENFWTVFAVFFPAVTGIVVGASMSGDLADPQKSIPRGTLGSILVTAVIYFAAAFWHATHADPVGLRENTRVMFEIARWPWMISMGVYAATLSSALGSVLAAPRTLQALATDRLVPRWMASQLGSPTEPRAAVLLTTGIALLVIWLGDLNFVAPVISMFFLNTYGMLNLVAGLERLIGNPSFRPQLKVPAAASLLGAVGCYFAMCLISFPATVVAVGFSYGAFWLIQRRSLRRTWGDARSGLWFSLARYALLELEARPAETKNWRPNILVFTGQPQNRQHLAEVADWLSVGRGIVTLTQLVVGDFERVATQGLQDTARRGIQQYIKQSGMLALAEAKVVGDFESGVLTAAQAHGMGRLAPNAVLLGWTGKADGVARQTRLLRGLALLGQSVLLLRYDTERGWGDQQRIDVWWRGRGPNADLMLLLAHLTRQHEDWRGAEIRLLRVLPTREGKEQAEAHLQQVLQEVRVTAEVVVAVRDHPSQPLTELFARHSQGTALTFFGTGVPGPDELESYGQRLAEIAGSVGSVLFVRSGSRSRLLDTS